MHLGARNSGGVSGVSRRRAVGLVAFALYAGTVVAANWFVQHVGQPTPGGGPHTIPVGAGYRAPSGVLWIGLAFTLRDVLQSTLGKRATLLGILVGAAISYLIAPALATASAVAFLVSEGLDFAVYTPLTHTGRVVLAARSEQRRWAPARHRRLLAPGVRFG